MDFAIFVRGVAIGLAIAAPVGPIGVLCIRRTLAEGRLAGFVTGLGAATADTVYGAVAAFGLTAVSAFLVSQQDWLRLIGGAFLLYLGIRTFLTRPMPQTAVRDDKSSRTLAGDYASTFLLTITNPLTIISFAAVFAGLGLGSGYDDLGSALLLVAGVFTGSALWWLLLSGGVSLLRGRITENGLRWVNRVSGVIITVFGVVALASLAG
ncbi:MAG: LysE family translocator [Anaerolineae bacterium]|nr:LysE family translocator [Anaerolineae bacterium]MCB0249822.1 LysE family translocator [Anaerolineae bacterium]MCB9133432.1 LysE family translocator [Anaerolineales bacterium]MCO5246587.1 LysE family translocator [Anaerolineae bacterium]